MNARQAAIVELLRDDEHVDVRGLAERFGVSPMTIRRDLTLFQEQGLVVRTHGGGIPAGKLRFLLGAFPHYAVSPQKAAIGKLAAGLVTPGQKVMVDSGTTTLEVARNLPKDADITVITTSLCVVQELYGSSVQVLLLGGYARREFPSLYGPLTEEALKTIHVDIVFMGCDGADSKTGFYTSDLRLSALEQQMTKSADCVVTVTESVKFGRKAFVRYAAVEQVNTLVTDTQLSPIDRKRLEESGVHVLLADAD